MDQVMKRQKMAALLLMASGTMLMLMLRKRLYRRRRKVGMNQYLLQRNSKGRFKTDLGDKKSHSKYVAKNFHMNSAAFEKLFNLVYPFLKPKSFSRPRDAISVKQKLVATLEFFAFGHLQRDIASCYRISKQHFGKIVADVSTALCRALINFMPSLTKEYFLQTTEEFRTKWDFPNCVGALDGKHIDMKAPPRSGNTVDRNKGFHLFAVSDASYKFMACDVGVFESDNDAKVFQNSTFAKKILNDTLPYPENTFVGNRKLPFFFVGECAFPLNERIMKPFSSNTKLTQDEIIFNYRLSRPRRCIENAFGIMSSRWQCLTKGMCCGPDKAQKIVLACCYLHNFLLAEKVDEYCPPTYGDYVDSGGNIIEGGWRTEVSSDSLVNSSIANRSEQYSKYGKLVRNSLMEYFNSPDGQIVELNSMINIYLHIFYLIIK